MTLMQGGLPFAGQPVGILMADTQLARIPGDVGNAFSYPFPVRFLTVKDASLKRIIKEGDPKLLQPFIDAARQLEREGCQAITTSCGFLVRFQKELAASVNIPVLTSALLQVPLMSVMLPPHKKIGVLTADARSLDPKLFVPPDMDPERIVIQGLEDYPAFYDAFPADGPSYVYEDARDDLLAAARKLAAHHPDLGAIVCECTNMPPFTALVARETGLPIFDIITLITYVASGILRGLSDPRMCRPY